MVTGGGDRWVILFEVEEGFVFFFFFRQKAAYEISACLVGSEVCIRGRGITAS